MCSECTESESEGDTVVGYYAVVVGSHVKTGGQDNSQHPKSLYPLDSGDEGLRWILSQVEPKPREYDLFNIYEI